MNFFSWLEINLNYIFFSGFLQRIRLLQFFGLLSKFADAVLHLLVLVELLFESVDEAAKKAALSWRIVVVTRLEKKIIINISKASNI